MKFDHIYGKHDPAKVKQAQDKLSKVFIELAAKPDNTSMITGLGGDALIFALMLPIEHVASVAIPTAATDGKRYIWNIDCILASSYLKLRLLCFHEAFHAAFMHPKRRGSRDIHLWNIAIDYVVMGMIIECLTHHYKGNAAKAIATFKEAFGNFITLDQLKAKYADPTGSIPGLDKWTPEPFDLDKAKHEFKVEDDLDDEDIKWLKEKSKRYKYVYADPNLPNELKRPEMLYDELLKAVAKCGECGKLCTISNPSNGNGAGSGDGEDGKGKSSSQGKQCGSCNGDMPGFGDLLDTHLDCDVDQAVLAKRLQEAVDMARRISSVGYIPAGLENELAELSEPKMRWQDELRMTKHKIAAGNQKNDYTRFRTRPMFAAMLVPMKRNYQVRVAVCIDTSASLTKEDIAFGVSQLASLDEQGTGVVVSCDAKVYWESATKLRSCKASELQGIKTKGGGGTALAGFINDYEEKLGKQDFIVVITDGCLFPDDIKTMKETSVPVFWLITSSTKFEPPFGKAFQLRD